MALDHDTMITPPIEELLGKVDSKFSLVTLAARRARHINSYFNQLGDGLGHMIPPQVSSTARKPLSIGFEEIADDKIVWTEAPEIPEEIPYDAEAEAQAMADAGASADPEA
jgi:DNA-directed RNA polymerase subunit omega